MAAGEDAPAPVIITPIHNNAYSIGANDTMATITNKLGGSISNSSADLQKNLDILVNLNTKSNQDAINALAAAHGAPADMGSQLGSAVSGINTSQIKDESQKLAKNMQNMLGDYDGAFSKGTDIYTKEHLKPTDPGTRGLLWSGANLSHELRDISKLSGNMGRLNANIVSINETYLNLLKLSSEDPAAVNAIPNLGEKLNSFNRLSSGTLEHFSQMGNSMNSVNNSYSALEKNGGVASLTEPDGHASNASVKEVGKSIKAFNEQLSGTNDEMASVLGSPQVNMTARVSQ